MRAGRQIQWTVDDLRARSYRATGGWFGARLGAAEDLLLTTSRPGGQDPAPSIGVSDRRIRS
jgi:hypothetical protein